MSILNGSEYSVQENTSENWALQVAYNLVMKTLLFKMNGLGISSKDVSDMITRHSIRRVNSSVDLKASDRIISVSSGSAITLTMDAMANYNIGDWHLFFDETDNWNTYNLTIARNSNVIVGESADIVIATKGSLLAGKQPELIYVVANKFLRK